MTVYRENLNIFWGSLIIEELIRNGIDYFCISPGSRSTPLTVGVARNPRARHIIVYDERAAAFHALGYARGNRKPAVLICTSGTAIANYYPAVVEAAMDGIPLIILSADRPPEKIETGANQTIRQSKFFGDYVRWQFDLPCPAEEIPPQMVLTSLDQAVHRAVSQPAGPVHVNCPFRDPLPPLKKKFSTSHSDTLQSWLQSNIPYTHYSPVRKSVDPDEMDRLIKLIRQARRGLLVIGRLKSESDREAAKRLARQLGWPVFADILSGIRLGNSIPAMIPYFDLMLLAETLQNDLHPDTVIHLGEQPASKRYLQFIEKVSPPHYVMIQSHPFRSDPTHRITWRIEGHISRVCAAMPETVKSKIDIRWLKQLQVHSKRIEQIVDHTLDTAVRDIRTRDCPASLPQYSRRALPVPGQQSPYPGNGHVCRCERFSGSGDL